MGKENICWNEICNKVMNDIKRSKASSSIVNKELVEDYSRLMAEQGYDLAPEIVDALSWYLKGYNLLISGCVGTGKTYFFKCLSDVLKLKKLPSIHRLTMIKTQGWDMEQASNWIEEMKDCDVLLDDVGTEPCMSSWGQKAELFPYLLEMRMMNHDHRMHITTNLSIGEIINRYGERVGDRMVQMFHSIKIKQTSSRRKQKPWVKPCSDKE
jgi:DNA replication protein DnaC